MELNNIKSYYKGLIALFLKIIAIIPSHTIRLLFLKFFFGLKISKKSLIYSGFLIRAPKKISIGSGTVVGYNSELDGRRGLTIGNNVNISSDVKIYTLQHDYNCPKFSTKGGPVVINDYAWISVRAILLPGITIGEGAVVAAGSVVTKDVEPFTVVGGIPAKKIATRNNRLDYSPSDHKISFV